MKKIMMMLLLLSACDETVREVIDAQNLPIETSCQAQYAITDSKALVVATVICPTGSSFRTDISIFDRDGFACGNIRDKVECGRSVVFRCLAPGLQTVVVRYSINDDPSMIDCSIVK